VTTKLLLIAALTLSAISLTGCNAAIGTNAQATSTIGDGNAVDVQQHEAQSKILREEARLADERAKIAQREADVAEREAELEKQKREAAEKELRELQESSAADTVGSSYESTNPASPSYATPKQARTSHHPRPQSEYYQQEAEETDEDSLEIGDVVECEDGRLFEVVAIRGNCVEYEEVEPD